MTPDGKTWRMALAGALIAIVAQPASADAAPPPALVVRSALPISGPIRYGQFYWDERAAPARGAVVITVDLVARVISVFRDGHEIGTAAVLKGYGAKPTPVGVFPVLMKDAHHWSVTYDAPMPWTLRLTPDGVSIHGARVAKGYATNGCIGVPSGFAQRLFAVARVGTPVIITAGKSLQVGGSIDPRPGR